MMNDDGDDDEDEDEDDDDDDDDDDDETFAFRTCNWQIHGVKFGSSHQFSLNLFSGLGFQLCRLGLCRVSSGL